MFATSLLLLTTTAMYPAPRGPEPDESCKGFFGVLLIDDGGVSITRVEPDSPADRAGVRPNDQILLIDSQKVPSVNDAREVIARLRPGRVVPVEVRRGDKTVNLKVRIGARSDTLP